MRVKAAVHRKRLLKYILRFLHILSLHLFHHSCSKNITRWLHSYSLVSLPV